MNFIHHQKNYNSNLISQQCSLHFDLEKSSRIDNDLQIELKDLISGFGWMFQRYEIVIDYEQRLKLPPPLTVISYVIMLFEWICDRQNYETFYGKG
ncbi:transient receptor potential cation channel subfamily M member 5-like [Brachionus plicatilis]|uniref:Transient receptor potential cation channel subfamily M member 5-like n=1 Tax=Brachionus plicatilis TaxID=10195 RepID=A0A3M7PMR0_BRAPC|nr:transient receptor potential cation channel subfamily M member 5-like [Brachionus plicatilis]